MPSAKPHIVLVFQTSYDDSSAMLRGIAKFQASRRYPWATFLDDQGRATADPRWLRSRPWNGVISRHTSAQLVEECRRLKLPLVDVDDCPPFPGTPKIRPDNIAIGHMGAEHFIERGYRNFAFCGYAGERVEWSFERRRGFVEGASLAGFSAVVFEADYPGLLDPEWDQAQVNEIAAWLGRQPRPLAVMACEDMRASQVLEACRYARLAVPEEVAVLGVNDGAIRCELCSPPLSSVATNSFVSGYTAAEYLFRMISGQKVHPEEARIDPVKVMVRNSTDILAIDDRIMTAALSFIRENACLGIAVSDVLQKVPASRSQLEKKFRWYIGRSPQAEIRQVQLGKAKQLLHETDFPLKRIAELVGFEHPEYLSVVFKRVMKLSPGAYRRHMQAQ